jgi:hypothetical protein
MSSGHPTPIDYCRAIVPLIGVTLGVYLAVVHSDQFWVEVIGYPNMALAMILLVLSLFAFGLGLLPLFVSAKKYQSSLRTTYMMATVVSFFVILVISTRISVTAQYEADFWFAHLQPLLNESGIAQDFFSLYDTDDDRKAFVRGQTATPYIVTCSVSYFWIVVLAFTERRHLFELLASLHYRDSGEAEKPEEESSPEEDKAEKAAADIEEVPIADADDGKASSQHGSGAETEKPAADPGGRDQDYSESEVVVHIEHPIPSAKPAPKGDIPARLRPMNFDPPPAPLPPAAGRTRREDWRYPLDDGVLSLSDRTRSYESYDYSDYSDWL